MKKALSSVALLLALASIFSFTWFKTGESTVRITITSDTPTTFDMAGIVGDEVMKYSSLATPYELEIDAEKARFLFKAADTSVPVTVQAEQKGKVNITANWPITVLLVEKNELETFGMD